MQEWLYRASGAKAGFEATQELAEEFGFVCRNAVSRSGQLIANVAGVTYGDVIHLYFVGPEGGRSLGAFRVVGPNNHPNAEFFGAGIPKTTLRQVAVTGRLHERLRELPGYEVEPQSGAYCGWPVVRDDRSSPAFDSALFPGRNALVPVAAGVRS